MLAWNGEIWLLERAKCGLETQQCQVQRVPSEIDLDDVSNFTFNALLSPTCVYFHLCMNSKLDFVPFTECIRNVDEE